MEYGNMNQEELIKTLEERDLRIATMESELKEAQSMQTDLDAELNSFKTELEGLKENYTGVVEELKKTKELNFTLGRQVSGDKELSTDMLLHTMFGEKKER